jgi:capsular exopolysaccharide synthesis family protein
MSGEGKTTLATQLAFSFARGGRRTLLVDGDLRRPDVHRIFGLPREGGFSEVLRSEMSLSEAIRPTLTPNLWVLTAGRIDQQALAALAQRQSFLSESFQKMREDFDFVIVDCCPVLPVVDTMLIGQHVDIAVLSVLRDVSQMPRIDEANRRLTNIGIRVFGAVVTGAAGGVYYHHEYHQEEMSV